MNKDKQREIWKKHHGYAGKSRKWAYHGFTITKSTGRGVA